jgi:sigma-E factor negative regulatory protein RseC
MARLSTSKRGPCEGCAEEGSCAPSFGPAGATVEELMAENPLGAVPGDRVEFELAGHEELKASLLVWLGPLVGLFLGAGLGVSAAGSIGAGPDGGAALGGLVGLALAYAVLSRIDRRAASDARLVPRIRKILSPAVASVSCSTVAGQSLREVG